MENEKFFKGVLKVGGVNTQNTPGFGTPENTNSDNVVERRMEIIDPISSMSSFWE